MTRIVSWQAAVVGVVAAAMLVGVLGVAQSKYAPQTRDIVVATVPLVIHEQDKMQPGLKDVFGPKGVLKDKEVYGFTPDTIIVYQGDKVNLTAVNPQPDDRHTFTLREYKIDLNLPPNTSAKTSFVASKVGIFPFFCDIGEHMPYMYGTLVVLPGSAAP